MRLFRKSANELFKVRGYSVLNDLGSGDDAVSKTLFGRGRKMKRYYILKASIGAMALIGFVAYSLGSDSSSGTAQRKPIEVYGFTLGMSFNSAEVRSCINRGHQDGWGVHCTIDGGTTVDLSSSGRGLNVLESMIFGVRYPGGLAANSPLRNKLLEKYGRPRVDTLEGEDVTMIWGGGDSPSLVATWRGAGGSTFIQIQANDGYLEAADQNALTKAAQRDAPVPKL
jgi:hypothetical protein